MKVLLCLLVSLAACKSEQQVVLYNNINCDGISETFDTDVPDLAKVNFDKQIKSARITGTWIFYEYGYYTGISHWMIGYGNCSTDSTLPPDYQNFFSSMRHVGNLYNFNSDTCTIYAGPNFTGNNFYTELSSPFVEYFERTFSLIIVGHSSWTLFSEENYGGQAVCFKSGTYFVLPNDHYIILGLYSVSNDTNQSYRVRSMAKGCYSDHV